MPAPTAVVMPDYAGPVGFALQGFTGAATGLAQAAQARTEQARWDKDMELRYQTLKEEVRNNNLNRDQREQFAQMEDLRARELQTQGENFLQHMAVDVTQPWEMKNNDLNRSVQMHGIERDYQASTYATHTARITAASQLAEQQRQFNETDGTEFNLMHNAMGGKTSLELQADPVAYETAINALADGLMGMQRVTGAPDVAQASPLERQKYLDRAKERIDNSEAYSEATYGRAQKLAQAMSFNKANGPAAFATGTDLVLDTPDANWKIAYPGTAPRKKETMSDQDKGLDSDIMNIIADGAVQRAQMGLDAYGVADVRAGVQAEIEKRVALMNNNTPRILNHYLVVMKTALYSDPTQDPAAAAGDTTLVGGDMGGG